MSEMLIMAPRPARFGRGGESDLNTYTGSFFEIEKYKTETHHKMNFVWLHLTRSFGILSAEDQKPIESVAEGP